MMKLADYEISPERGFLADFEPADVTLADAMAPIRDAAMRLPHWLPTGRIRALASALPEPDIEAFIAAASDAQVRLAMVHYSFLVQSYVWGHPDAPERLPANLARPIWRLAGHLGQQPLLPYSGYVLDNWGRIDRARDFDLDNLFMLQPFLGGQDEAWFVTVHVAIEARAGRLLEQFPVLMTGADARDSVAMLRALTQMCQTWDDINAIFDRMPERCDPYIYFHRVRPWIHGWRDNPALGDGLIYDGVAETHGEPQQFRGQTGSQSSIVPAVDAVLGLGHADDPLRRYLDELHMYRPPQHRRFIDDVRAASSVRGVIAELGDAALVARYNECVEKLAQFRTRHLEYAATYINKQQRDHAGNAIDIGTGGTPFMKYLKKHRNETQAQLIRDRLAV